VTDVATTITESPTPAVITFELWSDAAAARVGEALGGALPVQNRSAVVGQSWRALHVEPTSWWLIGPLESADTTLEQLEWALQKDGAAAELSGGLSRLCLRGPDWRGLLMIGGVFDAESAAFGPGCTAGSLLHHIGVRYDVVADDEAHVYVARSYADDLLHHLRDSLRRPQRASAEC
jgi:heterotetrameric sarcosine oxidase gamma subunit